MEAKTGLRHLQNADRRAGTEREKVKIDAKDLSFWQLLESSLSDILTPDEIATFITKMKKVMCTLCSF
jgi:hypothetical protein